MIPKEKKNSSFREPVKLTMKPRSKRRRDSVEICHTSRRLTS